MTAMSSSAAEPVVVVLDETQGYSMTYNPPDDAVTANLPNALPIEKVSNKRKLMLLIYFAQRDLFTAQTPRKIDAHTTVEQRIVERIIFQFSNYAQGIRTLNEYSCVGDYVDVSNGLGLTKALKDNGARDLRAVKMTITTEVSTTIRLWFMEVLNSQEAA
jgi:hypothetical protein